MTDAADNLQRARAVLARAGIDTAAEPAVRRHGRYSCPDLSGIAMSFNPYAWNEYIDPQAGVARLAFGLSSHFQNRDGYDFTRLVSLNAPNRRPETSAEDIARTSQRRVDVLNHDTGKVETVYFADLLPDLSGAPLPLLTSEFRADESAFPILTFERLLSSTRFVADLRAMLTALRDGFGGDVAIEFAAEISPDGKCRFCVLASSPFPELRTPENASGSTVFESAGVVIGTSRRIAVDRIVRVSPAAYSGLKTTDRYEIARLIGRIHRASETRRVLLLGPGRWCTSSPDLGIPTHVSEVERAAAIVEIVAMREGLVPEVSRGAHLLNELVAMDILYLAIFPGTDHNALHDERLAGLPNRLADVVPGAERWRDAVCVVDAPGGADLLADVKRQKAVCLFSER